MGTLGHGVIDANIALMKANSVCCFLRLGSVINGVKIGKTKASRIASL